MAPLLPRLVLVALVGSAAPAVPASTPGTLPRSLTLSEGWLFQPDPEARGDTLHWENPGFDRRGWRPVTVPMAWDQYDPVMDGYEGVGWYAIALPAGDVASGAWQRLRFGRANHRATVWIDGHKAGENVTGYLPFEVAATPWLRSDRPSWIVVRVENGVRYEWLPGATTVEWVQYGGLLEPVELLTTSPAHLTQVSIHATPRGADGRPGAAVRRERRDRFRRGPLRGALDRGERPPAPAQRAAAPDPRGEPLRRVPGSRARGR